MLGRALQALFSGQIVKFAAQGLSQFEDCIESHNGDKSVYMRRYYLAGYYPSRLKPWLLEKLICGIRVHHIVKPDNDVEFHDHPYKWMLSIVLSGDYIETRLVDPVRGKEKNFSVTTHNWLRGDTFHKIISLGDREVWTLFISGPKIKSWGFYNTGTRTYTPWRSFVGALGQEQS
jgi:hypothetical protein